MNTILVSVCCITYNQEDYIRECLNSILNQKCNFTVEIIINDDNSNDRTSEICKEFVSENKNKDIKYRRNDINLGMMGNWTDCIKRCEGKYIALCEGDDYWIDSNKLQKQVDFLETHPNYVGCFHNTEERYENDDKSSFLYCNYENARKIDFRDLAFSNVMPTCSVLYKKGLFGSFPDWYYKLKMCDWPLHLLNSQYGDFWYIPKVMAVHRLHYQSTWMLQDIKKNIGHVVDAYKIMINEGFNTNENLTALLEKGRQEYVMAYHLEKEKYISNNQSEKKNISVKNKIKSKLIDLINKF